MAIIYRANDVSDAIQYAASLRKGGSHNWFRGQLEDFPIRSSFTRLDEAERETALEKIARFEHWVKSTRGTEAIAHDVNSFAAVAQHYGLPTNYVDFTTNPEIAAFFAADNPNNRVVTRNSCIICLDTNDLKDFWNAMPPKYPAPEFIRVEVPNLWRLESQEGCFLFCPYGNFENIYDLDRIVFAYKGPLTSIPRTKIYPLRKSSLEILLDQFFMNERLIKGTREMHELPAFREMAHITVPAHGGWDPEFCEYPPTVLDSWTQGEIRQWLEPKRELFSRVSAEAVVSLTLRPGFTLLEIRSNVESAILSALSRDPLLRTRLVRWEVHSGASPEENSVIAKKLERLWDGIRILPYSAEQVTYGMAQCVALWAAARGKNTNWLHVQEQAAKACMADPVEVEFGPLDGSYSKGFASQSFLLRAVRPDVATYLRPSLAPIVVENMTGLLQAIQEPARLFDFSVLADLFVRQLAPSQVLFRDESVAIFYSPATIDRFGLP